MTRARPRVALVVPRMSSGEKGGAEILWACLSDSLSAEGAHVELLEVTSSEADYPAMLRSYARCYDLELDAFDLVVSTKSPTYMVRHRNHVSLLVHTPRVFYDRFEAEFGHGSAELRRQRSEIHELDLAAFDRGLIRARFAIGRPVVERLIEADEKWRDLPFEVVDLPPRFRADSAPDSPRELFLLPGRLHRWKRVDLAIEAVRRLEGDTPLHVTGRGEDEDRIRAAAKGDPRIRFRGFVSDDELRDLYARAIAVPFVPVQEDFGFITVEAFARGTPVVTCSDSGHPAHVVAKCGGGRVVDPEPAAIARALGELRDDRALARRLGDAGRQFAESLSWGDLARSLLAAGGWGPNTAAAVAPHEASPSTRLAVIDTQPIEPPVGGGRLRLFGLYRTLDPETDAVYVGSYDWRGPGRRTLRHEPRLEERTIPHTESHFAAADSLRELAEGATVIDVTQPLLAPLSTELLAEARRAMEDADVVVFSHPWLYSPLATDVRRLGRPVIYDAQNVEWTLRREVLAGTPVGRALAEAVGFWERELCDAADLVLACSEEDAAGFRELHDVPPDRVVVVPNGVDTTAIVPADDRARRDARRDLGLDPRAFAAVFIGSAYGPNVDAARWILEQLAPSVPEIEILIVGGVGTTLPKRRRPKNVRVLGAVDDEVRLASFHAADVAINPIPYGSGTNIKMFDFFAAGLPVVSSPAGARGIEPGDPPAFLVREMPELAAAVRSLASDAELRAALGRRARSLAGARYDWAGISQRVAELARSLHRRSSAPAVSTRRPAVSVVVPSYGRREGLRALLDRLRRQTFRDFEVVVVEQGETLAPIGAVRGLCVSHLRTPVRGAVRARNTGLALAEGEIVAFVDDDCLPEPGWLAALVDAFDDPEVVGAEGLVVPDVPNPDPRKVRIVSNEGFEGFGFMTANLAVRRDTAREIGGFDEIFDHPHFREDTDFGWRLSERGDVPFVQEACVVHPLAPRTVRRESAAERAAFFEKDPVLFEKHPGRYPALFVAEGHYLATEGFWPAFRRGIEKYGVQIDVERLVANDLVREEEIPVWLPSVARG